MKKLKNYYYVYESSEINGRKYIGYRGCDCKPEEDIKYFGSFSDKTFKPTEKEIICNLNVYSFKLAQIIKCYNFC